MQNRIISSQMLKELDSINKSRNTITKALMSESRCFRLRFSKHESAILPAGSEKIYPYLFSHGEIDPEKVICMHLLTVQILELPANLTSKRMISQAIFKSFEEEDFKYKNILPVYKLESEFHRAHRTGDSDVKELKLVNKRIELLISIIMDVLKEINNNKYLQIIELAKNKTEIFKLLKNVKLRNIFNLCEKSTVLTDLRCYKATSIISNTASDYKYIKRITMPSKCIVLEKFIGNIRNQLLKEIQIVCQKNDSDQLLQTLNKQTENNILQLKDSDLNEGLIRKLEFSEITQIPSGESKNIITESPSAHKKMTLYKLNNSYNWPFQTGQQTGRIHNRKDEKERTSILLKKMNNDQRLRLGKKVAELKSRQVSQGIEEKRISLDEVFQEVLSKRSLEDLFCSALDEENKVFFKSYENSTNEYSGKNETEEQVKPLKKELQQNSSQSGNRQENNSNFIYAKIKQDIINKETNKKITKFLAK